MNKTARLAACVLILCATQTGFAQTPTAQFATDVDLFVQLLMSQTGLPSLAIAVVKGDEPVLVKGYGFADIERKVPATENSAFYTGSLTKAFTALTVSLMAERGVVDLDAPITRYLKGVKWDPSVNPDSITLRRLLSHTHGIKQEDNPVVWRTAYMWCAHQRPAQGSAAVSHRGGCGKCAAGSWIYSFERLNWNG